MVKDSIEPHKIIEEYALELKKKIRISKIILFGSFARGNPTKDSDIDLIILSNSFKRMSFIKRLQLLSHARSGNAKKIPMDILGYTPSEAKKLSRTSSMLKEAFKQGKLVWS